MKKYVEGLSLSENGSVLLSPENRNLLSVAYKNVVGAKRKNVVGAKRSSWRVVASMEQKKNQDISLEVLKNYKSEIETELKDTCKDVIVSALVINGRMCCFYMLDSKLISEDGESESYIFFMKMKGDYYRYLCEVEVEDRNGKFFCFVF